MSKGVDSRIGAYSDTKSTGCDSKSTDHDTKSTDHDTFTTLGDTFAHDANVDLRRIALDFLTDGNRVGEHTSRILSRCIQLAKACIQIA